MPEHVRREGAAREVLVSEALASTRPVLRGSRAATENRLTLPGRHDGIRGDQHTPRVTEARRSFIRTRTQRAVVGRRVFPFLAFTTLTVALLAGFVVTIIDKEDFPNYGTAVWWAIVTLGTVGYGDVVPHTGWGRVVGSVVIIVGVTFIAFLTAVVTSLFVEEEQKTHRTLIEDAQRAYQTRRAVCWKTSPVAFRRSRRCCATCRAGAADAAPSRVPASFVSHLPPPQGPSIRAHRRARGSGITSSPLRRRATLGSSSSPRCAPRQAGEAGTSTDSPSPGLPLDPLQRLIPWLW